MFFSVLRKISFILVLNLVISPIFFLQSKLVYARQEGVDPETDAERDSVNNAAAARGGFASAVAAYKYSAQANISGIINTLSIKVYCGITGLFTNSCDDLSATTTQPVTVPTDTNVTVQTKEQNVYDRTQNQTTIQTTGAEARKTVVERIVERVTSPVGISGVTAEYVDARIAELAAQLRSEMGERTIVYKTDQGSSDDDRLSRQIDNIYEDMDDSIEDAIGQIDTMTEAEIVAAIASSTASIASGPSGYVLQSTGTTTQWVATSTLGFGSSIDLNAISPMVVGNTNAATGTNSVAFGNQNLVGSGGYGNAFGTFNSVQAGKASAFGYFNTASGYYSSVFGSISDVSGNYSTVIGHNSTVTGASAFAGGYYSEATADYATALGYNARVTAQNAVAIGSQVNATADNSAAFGVNNTASALRSIAIGYGNDAGDLDASAIGVSNSASGYRATASGYNNTASGYYSSVFGAQSTASGNYSTASGYYSRSTGPRSTSVGYQTLASGVESSAFGTDSRAEGDYSSASGYYSRSTGHSSAAFGFSNLASGTRSFAFGGGNQSMSDYSSTFGYLNQANAENATALGNSVINNIANSVMIGPSDAAKITILSSGNVGIGTTTPTYRLDLGTDYNTTAPTFRSGLFALQPYNVDTGFMTYNAYFNGVWHRMTPGYASFIQPIRGQMTMNLANTGSGSFTPIIPFKADFANSGTVALGGTINTTTNNYTGASMVVLGTGNVGVGTTSPAQKLDVWGNFQVGTSSTPTLFVSASSGRVGINTAAQYAPLYVYSGQEKSMLVHRNTTANLQAVGINLSVLTGFSDQYQKAGIFFQRDDSYLGGFGGGKLVFAVNNTADSSNASLSDAKMVILPTGYVGIGTTTPGYKLSVAGDVSLTGALRVGTAGADAGTAGYVLQTTGTGAQWVATSTLGFGSSDLNGLGQIVYGFGNATSTLGTNAAAIGYQNSAAGAGSVAVGYLNQARSLNTVLFGNQNFTGVNTIGTSSVAIGLLNNATGITVDTSTGLITGTASATTTVGHLSTAVGIKNSALSRATTLLGYNNNTGTVAQNSTAIGYDNFVGGHNSVALGADNLVASNANYGIAIGYNNQSYNVMSMAMGYLNSASAYGGSWAIGRQNSVSGSNSIAIGRGSTINSTGSNGVAIGQFHTISGTTNSYLFGNTLTGEANRIQFGLNNNNKVTIDDSGRLSLGTTTPVAMFAINRLNNASHLIYAATSTAGAKFVVRPDASVGIGTTTPGQMLTVVGSGQFTAVGSDAYAFDLNLTADGVLTTSASDERLKENVELLDSKETLERLMQLKPSTFDWKSNGAHDIGLIAQEVEDIFPGLVFTNKTDGYKGVNYSRLPALLISGIQELNGMFDSFVEYVEDGVAYLNEIVVKRFTAKQITVQNEDSWKTGVTIYDQKTGEPICMFVYDGEMKTEPGACEDREEPDDEEDDEEQNDDQDTGDDTTGGYQGGDTQPGDDGADGTGDAGSGDADGGAAPSGDGTTPGGDSVTPGGDAGSDEADAGTGDTGDTGGTSGDSSGTGGDAGGSTGGADSGGDTGDSDSGGDASGGSSDGATSGGGSDDSGSAGGTSSDSGDGGSSSGGSSGGDSGGSTGGDGGGSSTP